MFMRALFAPFSFAIAQNVDPHPNFLHKKNQTYKIFFSSMLRSHIYETQKLR